MQYNTKNFYTAQVSSARPGSKALPAKEHKTENVYHVQRKAIFVIKRSGSQLTKKHTIGQKRTFLDVAESKSGIQKSGYIYIYISHN